jgi:hypothetical protein
MHDRSLGGCQDVAGCMGYERGDAKFSSVDLINPRADQLIQVLPWPWDARLDGSDSERCLAVKSTDGEAQTVQ